MNHINNAESTNTTTRRAFIRLVGGGAVFAATMPLLGCSSDLPAEAIAAWKTPGQGSDLRKQILSYAILAPHPHNLQSWLVDLKQPNAITLYCDTTRLLPETDPYSRQILIGQGTFLELLDMAAKQLGYRAEITLFPEGAFEATGVDRRPTARITLTPNTAIAKDPLFDQILKRRTNRQAYELKDIPTSAIQAITASVAGLPVQIGFAGNNEADLLKQHKAIAKEAWRIELTTPRTILESLKLMRVGPSEIKQNPDGISNNSPFIRAVVALGLFDRSKAPASDDSSIASQIKDFDVKIDATSAFFYLVTKGNDRQTQINAGRAYVRAQLAATAQGLSMHPVSQALQEYPEQAKTYLSIHKLLNAPPATHTVQMWTRIGFAPAQQPSPRRGVDQHITTV
jgi:nitroreductase